MQALSRVVERSHEIVWGVPTLLLLTGVGVLLSVRTRFVQIRRFGAMLRLAGGAFSRRERTRGGVSPLQAMCMALGATVGTGNIAGVAGAIALGGPGAVFWMWVSAILGMATKYAEAVLAVKFRVCDGAGGWVGGPMYYIRALHARMRPLAAAFALFGALAAFGIGNMAQVNTVANAVCTAAESVFPEAAAARQKICATVGILCALAVAAVLLGGAAGVGRVASRLVPAMSLLYIVAALAVILANLPGAARAGQDRSRRVCPGSRAGRHGGRRVFPNAALRIRPRHLFARGGNGLLAAGARHGANRHPRPPGIAGNL